MKPLISPPNLTERVYGAIVDEILDGTLEPGQHLVQEHLAAELGVSRQPIQQAMALLRADGLIEEAGRRGMTVARLDIARMRDHYEIRAVLDGYGARAAADAVASGRLNAASVAARFQAVLSDGVEAARSAAMRDQIRLDEEFHGLIYTFSGNAVLAETSNPNWRFLRRAMADVLRHAEPPQAIWDQHRMIAAAVTSGDAEQAETLAREHVRLASQLLSAALEERVTEATSKKAS